MPFFFCFVCKHGEGPCHRQAPDCWGGLSPLYKRLQQDRKEGVSRDVWTRWRSSSSVLISVSVTHCRRGVTGCKYPTLDRRCESHQSLFTMNARLGRWVFSIGPKIPAGAPLALRNQSFNSPPLPDWCLQVESDISISLQALWGLKKSRWNHLTFIY